MHELSIATSIVDIAIGNAADAKRIKKVELELGVLAGVIVDSLIFCFDAVCKGTIAEGAKLVVKEIEGKALCLDCSASIKVKSLYSECSSCGSYKLALNKGKELAIKAILVED